MPATRLPLLALVLFASATLAVADPPRVVVIGVDAKTQKALGPFGGSYRGHHAKLIEKLNASGVKAIAFDMYFPENAERVTETAALAQAADASKAPVTIAIYAEEAQDGSFQLLASDKAFAGTKTREGSVITRRELTIKQDAEGLYAETGGLLVGTHAGEHRSLMEVTLASVGIADKARIESLGIVEQVTVGYNGAEVKQPAIRPNLGKKPLTLSYSDVLSKKPHPALEGAIVVIGMTDGVQDVHENPDPKRPKMQKVSGVYLHAAMAERIVAAVAADEAKKAKAAQAAAAKDSGNRTGLSEVIEREAGEKAKK